MLDGVDRRPPHNFQSRRATTRSEWLVPLKLTGGLLICNCGSTVASVHPPPATHVRLQPEAFGLESASIPSSAVRYSNLGARRPLGDGFGEAARKTAPPLSH